MGEDLIRLFSRHLGPAERARAFKAFGTALRAQAGDVSRIADQGAEALAAAVTRLPIRDTDSLREEYGFDDEVVAQRVIEDAAKLAGWLWTAAGAFPAPPPVVHTVKVVVHSAIELRLIGELYALHGDPASARDTTWLNIVLHAWAVGHPVATGPGAIAGVRDLATKLRQSYVDLVGDDSRLARLANRGREGSDAIRRVGWRYHRRMRLHPETWPQPTDLSGLQVMRQAAEEAVRGKLPLPSPRGQEEDELGAPVDSLTEAWAEHRLARGGVGDIADGVVRERLSSALVLQETHLSWLSAKLGQPIPGPMAVPELRAFTDAVSSTALVNQHVQLADDAIDRAEDAGTRPRRLAGWPVRVRNGLVYLLTAMTMSAPIVWLILTGHIESRSSLLALALICVVVPFLTLAVGVGIIGSLFRPWLGGKVQRSPITGLVTGFVTMGLVAVGQAVASLS